LECALERRHWPWPDESLALTIMGVVGVTMVALGVAGAVGAWRAARGGRYTWLPDWDRAPAIVRSLWIVAVSYALLPALLAMLDAWRAIRWGGWCSGQSHLTWVDWTLLVSGAVAPFLLHHHHLRRWAPRVVEQLCLPEAATYRGPPRMRRRFAEPDLTHLRAERLLAPRVAVACASTFAVGLSLLHSTRYLHSTLRLLELTGGLLFMLLLHAPLRSSAMHPVTRRARIDSDG
jgi:hypothetical protein